MVTNLDIWYKIEKMMSDAEGHMSSYLNVLSERHEYMTLYRKEYRKLNDAVSRVKNTVLKEMNNNLEQQNAIKKIRSKINKRIEVIEEEYNTEENSDNVIKDLQRVLDILEIKNIKEGDLEEVQTILKKVNIDIKDLNDLSLTKTVNNSSLEQLLALIKAAESDYLNSFKEYKRACEHSDEVFDAFDDIVGVLLEYRFADEANNLINALPDIEDSRKKRPDPEPLLEILVPIKSSGLEYWKSTYRNSYAHDYNIAFAKEIAYVRRALLEEREFRGTQSAFNRLNDAYADLRNYMYSRYHELGGTPYNYHGHLDRH
ncbi:hypothetical protein ACE3L8_12335 [Staphylococcus simulans]|uniref:hypothetical protein n=1 Tax=Staphylococcus simulans TaxID=1286 RepID=UPI003659C44E